ncbi:NAD(P)/FAD-dependent oxidoreductase [Neolewinella lacunae]|uniref:NAD(P)/FAD-dependent oxidoreductase n=1 Tax=Neolewinella lacunae TaxID=1517758 RepID=A0A923T9H5_9BACT|nr:NAD(P)/FAD-dependent oxidoreductase [Neolewinella lacunae]MBC6995068.1 NAD(P)/FAD-dependent oxidoreductase [Neolewinella lacunae]MDN3635383.1 NAD(P)/FAD-dependent oxidoreductase [Neolewinella lacunae]
MNNYDCDILIVGSGPAGATLARYAAAAGLSVLLVDKRQELGAPIQCSGAVSRHALEEVGIPLDEEFILEAIYGFAIYDQSGSATRIDYRQLKGDEYGEGEGKKPLGYVVDRRRFDRYLMTLAERSGAETWLKTEGLGYRTLPDGRCEVSLRNFNRLLSVRCKVLVGADGLQSQVGKWAGLQTHIKITELAGCLQFIVDQVETDGLLEIITGHEWAPGGYAWVFPKGHGYAEIGLGVISTMTDHNAQWHLDKFIQQSFFKDRFRNCRILEIQGGGVPLAAPLRTQYADNLILVGDAARHVNPITGGGIHTALSGAKVAADFLVSHLAGGQQQDFSAAQLKGYQDAWLAAIGNKMWELYHQKTKVFHQEDIPTRDAYLYRTMSDYFDPNSPYKKV